MIFPFVLILVASFFQGTFGVGMKYMKPLSWEAWWLIYSFIGMILFPDIWALIAVPDLFDSIFAASSSTIFKGMFYGFLWGIGGILFGVSVNYVGVSITYGIVMGLASAAGSLIPLFQMPDARENPAFPVILIGVAVMLIGVALSAVAGEKRDRIQSGNEQESAGIKKGKAFRLGLLIAIISGLLSALLNVGFANASGVAEAAVDHGAITRNASLAAWVVVLWGAFIMNGLYCLILFIKNNSWGSYRTPNASKAYRWAIITGLLWFGALGIYGQGAALIGDIGPVIGWPILLGLALIISNVWAVRTGEWKNSGNSFILMLISLFVLIFACIILGYANSL